MRSACSAQDEIPVALEVFDGAVAGSPGYARARRRARRPPGRLDLLGPHSLHPRHLRPLLDGGGPGAPRGRHRHRSPQRHGTAAARRRPARHRGDGRAPGLRADPGLLRGARVSAVSRIPDFYAPGDDQVVYVKRRRPLSEAKMRAPGSSDARGSSSWKPGRKSSKQNSIASLDMLAAKFGPENFPDLDRLRQAAENFEFRISPAMVELIKSPDDPIWRQYVPDGRGARDRGRHRRLAQRGRRQPGAQHHPPLSRPRALPGLAGVRQLLPLLHPAPQGGRSREDPDVAVRERLPVPRAAHRDPRRHHVRRRSAAAQRPAPRGHPAPGSAPFPHLEIIRIGSRIPCHLPERITPELCAMLQKYHPLYINTHFNHPDELTPGRGGRPRPAGRRRAFRSAARRCCSRA